VVFQGQAFHSTSWNGNEDIFHSKFDFLQKNNNHPALVVCLVVGTRILAHLSRMMKTSKVGGVPTNVVMIRELA